MAYAQGSYQQTLIAKETTFGTSPAEFSILPVRSNTLKTTKATLQDDTLRSDRQPEAIRTGMKNVGGDISVNFRYGDYDSLLEGVCFGEWATNTLKIGTTPISFSIEKGFTDIDSYTVYKGCMVNTMSLNLTPDALLQTSFSFIGQDSTTPSGTSIDASPTAHSSNKPFDSFTGSILEGGSAIASITGMELTINNQLGGRAVLFSNIIEAILAKQVIVSGKMTALFANNTLLTKFLNETETSIEFTITDLGGNDYIFTLPALKYTNGDPSIDSDGEIPLPLDFSAHYDSSSATTMTITRVPA